MKHPPHPCRCTHAFEDHRPTIDVTQTYLWHCRIGCYCLGFGSGEYVAPRPLPRPRQATVFETAQAA